MIYDLIGPKDKASTPTVAVDKCTDSLFPGDLLIWGEFTSKTTTYHISDHEHVIGQMDTHEFAMASAAAIHDVKRNEVVRISY